MMAIPSAKKGYYISDLGEPFQTDGLRKRISEGLTSTPKSLPSLLLWDERGHQLFEAITKSKDYYGTIADKEILFENLELVCDMIADGGILIELGSGCLPASTAILRALANRGTKVTYFAHDICKEQLLKSLDSLSHTLAVEEKCSIIELHGVVGTYEDSVSWIRAQTSFSQQRVVVLWLGNCLADIADFGVTTLIQSLGAALLHVRPMFSRLVIAFDGCKDQGQVSHAYDAPDGTSSAFVSNALVHANRVLGQNTFSSKEWQAMHIYDADAKSSAWGFRSRDSRMVTIGESTVAMGKGEFLEIIKSRKRAMPEVVQCVDGTNTEIVGIFAHSSLPWAWYVLRIADCGKDISKPSSDGL